METPSGRTDTPLTLAEHLQELRARLIKVAATVALGMVGGIFAAGGVQGYFIEMVGRAAPGVQLIATTATEKITVFFTIALYLGIAFAMPVIIYQAIRFLAPGLTPTERRYTYALLPAVLACFAAGVLFALTIAIPQMLHYLLGFGDERIAPTPRAAEILGFCSDLALWSGVFFELPVLLFGLASLNILPYRVLRRGRKVAAVGLMVAAAIITPTPDALSMLIIWAPMYLLFELGLILARFARPRATSSTLVLLLGLALAGRARRAPVGVRAIAAH